MEGGNQQVCVLLFALYFLSFGTGYRFVLCLFSLKIFSHVLWNIFYEVVTTCSIFEWLMPENCPLTPSKHEFEMAVLHDPGKIIEIPNPFLYSRAARKKFSFQYAEADRQPPAASRVCCQRRASALFWYIFLFFYSLIWYPCVEIFINSSFRNWEKGLWPELLLQAKNQKSKS